MAPVSLALLPLLLQMAHASPFAIKRDDSDSSYTTLSTVASISLPSVLTAQPVATVNPALATAAVTIPDSYTLPDPTEPPGAAASTSAPTSTSMSCTLQEQDPDEGITEAYCACGSTKLPVKQVTDSNAGPDASCAYSDAAATPSTTISELSLSTWTSNCMVCSDAVVNEQACSTMAGCTPTKPPAPTMSVQAANVKVNFGEWEGADSGPGMFSTISSLLDGACPTPTKSADTACQSSNLTAPIEYVDSTGSLSKAEIMFNVAGSNYTDKPTRDQLIAVVAGGFAKSASGKNCGATSYHGLCVNQTPEEQSTDMAGCADNVTTCYSSNAFYAQSFPSQYTDQPAGLLWVEAKFQETSRDQAQIEFVCEFVIEAIEAGQVLTQPELAGVELPADIEWQAECLDALGAT